MLKQYLYHDWSGIKTQKQLESSHRILRAPTAVEVKDGIVLPRVPDPANDTWGLGGVFTAELNFVEQSREKGFGGPYSVDREKIARMDCDVLYLGYFIQHWGVFLADSLRRLYWKYLPQNSGNPIKIAYCGIGIAPNSFGKIAKNCQEFFRLLGLEETDLIDVRQPTQFSKVIVPELGYEFDGEIFDEFLLPYRLAAENCISSPPAQGARKIYLSRTRFNKKLARRKELGEKLIEQFFERNGFEIIYPEQLSVTEQIQTFRGAETIASIEGSVAHNILFSRPGTRQIILRKQQEMNPRQFLFDEACGIHLQYIDCYKQPLPHFPIDHDLGPFLLLFNRNLLEFARDNGMACPRFYRLHNCLTFLFFPLLCFKCLLMLIYSRWKKSRA